MSLYDDLGVPKDASADDIKRAFRKRAHENHPDKGGTPEKFYPIQRAYAVLGNPHRRSEYDRSGNTNPVDSRDEALAELAGLLLQVIAREDVDPDRFRLIDWARDHIRKTSDSMHKEIAGYRKTIAKRERVLKRLRHKKGTESVVFKVFAAAIEATRQGIYRKENEIKKGDAMLEILEDYDYALDEEVKPEKALLVLPSMFTSWRS